MSHQVHVEIERKYEVDDRTEVPDLTSVGTITRVSDPATATLEAVYYDSREFDLAAQRIALRRRSGGADEGWHIKLPGTEGRIEMHWPLGDEGPIPDEVLDQVLVHVRDHPLEPVARLTTVRTTTVLYVANDTEGGEGEIAVAEVCDDLVTAGDVASGALRVWREWEVELTDDAPGSPKKRQALLDSIEKALLEAGARPSTSISKLAHALGRNSLDDPTALRPLARKPDAAEVVRRIVGDLTARLKAADPLVRQDEADAVHAMRSSVRRLRSVLDTYRSIVESPEASRLESELMALGIVLGEARDPQVMHDRARNLVRSQPNKPMHDVVLTRLVNLKQAEYHRALGYLHKLLATPRYFRLLDALEQFAAGDTVQPHARRAASKALAAGLADDYAKVAKHMKKVDAAANQHEWHERIHSVRKAARRLRFAAEAVSTGDTAIFGVKVGRLALAAERVQDALGEYRDSVLLQQLLHTSAEVAHTEGENTFGYGRLHALEQQRSDRALEDYSRAREQFRQAKKWVPEG